MDPICTGDQSASIFDMEISFKLVCRGMGPARGMEPLTGEAVPIYEAKRLRAGLS